jgi:hypothetical protein
MPYTNEALGDAARATSPEETEATKKMTEIADKIADGLFHALQSSARGSAPDMIYELATDVAIDTFGSICKAFGAKIHQAVFIIIAPGDVESERVRLFVQAEPKERAGVARAVNLAAGDLNNEMREHARSLIMEAQDNESLREPDDDEPEDKID